MTPLFDISGIVADVMRRKVAAEESVVREMLGRWVSGLEPAIAMRDGEIIGLTAAEFPIGVICPIVVRPLQLRKINA